MCTVSEISRSRLCWSHWHSFDQRLHGNQSVHLFIYLFPIQLTARQINNAHSRATDRYKCNKMHFNQYTLPFICTSQFALEKQHRCLYGALGKPRRRNLRHRYQLLPPIPNPSGRGQSEIISNCHVSEKITSRMLMTNSALVLASPLLRLCLPASRVNHMNLHVHVPRGRRLAGWLVGGLLYQRNHTAPLSAKGSPQFSSADARVTFNFNSWRHNNIHLFLSAVMRCFQFIN